MLIAAFKVEHLRSIAVLEGSIDVLEVFVGFANGKPTDAGIEPDVENVGLFAEAFAAAVCTGHAFGQHRVARDRMPGLRALAVEEVDNLAVQRCVENRLIASVAQEHCNRNTPDALTADAPVRPRGDHVGDAFFTPTGVPDHFVDLLDGQLAEGGL